MEQAEARKLWLEAVERVKDRTIAPTLWIALEKGHGITTEDEFFIVGYPPADAPMGGYLLSSENKRVIEKVLTELLGKPSRIKVIDGTTVNDFVVFKKREEVAENTRRQAQERKHVERAAERARETVSEQCSRKYANTHLRQLPQIRGQFLFEAVKVISDAMDRIHPDGEIDEIGHRALGRVIERVATLTDVPGATVAVELIRLRNALKRASDS